MQSVPNAEASFADIRACLDAESQDQTKGCYTQNMGRCLPQEVQIQRAKGPATQVPKMDCKVATERKIVQNEGQTDA